MTHDITIPPEAVEAATREITMALVLAVDEDCRACALTDDERKELALSALRAGIAAWPGMFYSPGSQVTATWFDPGKVILPIPTENTNAEA